MIYVSKPLLTSYYGVGLIEEFFHKRSLVLDIDDWQMGFQKYERDRSGNHRDEGVFIASDPNVKKLDRQIEVEIVDILPTILYLSNLPIPRYVDGTVITSIVKEAFQDENPVEYTDAYRLLAPRSTDLSEEERAMIEEHLRALGYF